MFLKRLGLASLVIGLGIGAAGCTDGYGYSGVNVGYASGYGYGDGYYDGGYGDGFYGAGYPGYAGGLGTGAFGWYGDYYYPGAGIYVYDRYRRPYRWNDGQRRYWEGRRGSYRGDRNWNGFGGGVNRPNGNWNGRDGNAFQNRGDRGGYHRNRGDRRDGIAPGATPGAQTRTFAPRTDGRTFTPRTEGQTFTPRTPRGDGQARGWRGRDGRR